MALNPRQQKHSDRLRQIIDIALDATDELETYQAKDQWVKTVAFFHCMTYLITRADVGLLNLDDDEK